MMPEPGGRSAADINPEAGSHPVPSDPREMHATLRAADICWQRFPYLAERYGERGLRFTRSDSAWLATLAGLGMPRVSEQVFWLRGVLATRGVPSLMLQSHLEILCGELDAAIPEEGAAHARLRRAAADLCEARRAHVSDERAAALSYAFDGEAGAGWVSRLPGTAHLLVSAVADEADGSVGAIGSLDCWLTDARRFPPAWIAAVGTVLSRASGAAG
jgi:hypothetical protein